MNGVGGLTWGSHRVGFVFRAGEIIEGEKGGSKTRVNAYRPGNLVTNFGRVYTIDFSTGRSVSCNIKKIKMGGFALLIF